jgi:hypothetical protein
MSNMDNGKTYTCLIERNNQEIIKKSIIINWNRGIKNTPYHFDWGYLFLKLIHKHSLFCFL